MSVRSDAYKLTGRAGTQLIAMDSPDGLTLVLRDAAQTQALLVPPALELASGSLFAGRWTTLRADPADAAALLAESTIEHTTGSVQATLRLAFERDDALVQPLLLCWQLTFTGQPCDGAIRWSVLLPDVPRDPALLELPSIHYGRVSYGRGMFPHPSPRHGFAFRADRLAQPALHYSAPCATWSFFTASETPDPPVAEQVYAIGAEPGADDATGLTLVLRYPQQEYGHRGDGSAEAYIGKETFAAGERASQVFMPDSSLSATLFLLCRPASAAHDSAVMRYLWQRGQPSRRWIAPTLLHNVGQHVQWFNRRLYNSQIGGGQYESPEGSGTAMLGFVEQSLLMASTTLRYALLCRSQPGWAIDELLRYCQHAVSALTHWATFGLSPEGLLYPVCDRSGYHFGARQYGEAGQLRITGDDIFDTIRLATEARSLISAALSVRQYLSDHLDGARLWLGAARSVADWLRAHPLPGGGYAGRYHRDGRPVDDDPAGTAAVISLFCDCALLLAQDAPSDAAAYRAAATAAFDTALADSCHGGFFAGGTLDASCPDREAAIAALDACIVLYELTDDERYLEIARAAADNVLSYTIVYDITTFGADTYASTHQIATRGATIVSPENQHLDPVPTAPSLLLYGLYTGDTIAVDAAVTTLRWTLDGRWAFSEPAGLKQSEQLLHTRWYYNTFFTRRGNVRTGMPRFGRSDSEHGWPQVVPSAAMLASGQIILDWRSGQAVGVDCFDITRTAQPDGLSIQLTLTPMTSQTPQAVLIKVLRLPPVPALRITAGSLTTRVRAHDLSAGHLLALPHTTTINLCLTLAPET